MSVNVAWYEDLVTRSGRRLSACAPGRHDIHGLARDLFAVGTECRPTRNHPIAAAVNGVPLDRGIDSVELKDGDEVILARAPGFTAGTLALVAIAVASAGASYALATRSPRPVTTSEPEEQRYGFGRFSTNAVAGDTVPVVFGRRQRYGGKVVATLPAEDPLGGGDARLKMLICLGHGVVNAIGNQTSDFDRVAASALQGVYLNDQPLSNFANAFCSGRMGGASQAVIPGFDDTEILREVGVGGVELANTSGSERTGSSASGEAFLVTTVGAVDAVVIRIRFPSGLFRTSGTGQLESRSVRWRWRERDTSGPGTWSDWTVVTVERADGSELFSAFRVDNLGGVQKDIQCERVSVEEEDATIVDRMLWDSQLEVTYSENTFDGFAMLALEIEASEQLSGIPTVSVDIQGVKCRVWDGISDPTDPDFVVEYTANPAWHALELVTNDTWGMGAVYGDSNIDFPSLIEAAQVNDERVSRALGGDRARYECNIVLDSDRDGVDWLRTILRTCRAVPVTSGGKWRFTQAGAQASAVEVFTDGSIAVGDDGVALFTYTREWAEGGAVRPNQTVVQYESAELSLDTDTVLYPDADADPLWLAAETANRQSVRLDGVTDPEQAGAQAIFEMNTVRFPTRSVRFTSSRPLVKVQPGDRFDVAVSLAGWGLASGRLRDGATATAVLLDRGVVLALGTTYTLRVVHLDGTIEAVQVTAPAGEYPLGAPIAVATMSQAPGEFAEYAIGSVGIEAKPFVATAVRPVEGAAGSVLWEVEGVEYVEGVYSDEYGVVPVTPYSSLVSPRTPPGPVVDLRAREKTVNGLRVIELSWRQTLADERITASFRVYRRLIGSQSWILVPESVIARRSAVIELDDFTSAYQFVVVAVGFGGAFLSPYTVGLPVASLAFGLGDDPLPPPDNLAVTQVADNTYKIEWDAVDGAAGYQVLTGGDTTTLPNTGAEDSLVLARTTAPELTGLELPPSQACRFWVRSVSGSGRLSWTASEVAIATPATPAGQSIVHTETFDLSAVGTLTNLAWNATTSRLELVSAGSDGVWESPEIDVGSPATSELTFRAGTANDADDPMLSTDFLEVPSIEADQWGVTDDSPSRVVGMLFPPYPDDEHEYEIEVRVHNGTSWGSYAAVAVFESYEGMLEKFQFRVTMRRGTAPYRPALRTFVGVVTA